MSHSFRHNNILCHERQGCFSILGSADQTHVSLATWLPVDCALKGMALAAIKMNF